MPMKKTLLTFVLLLIVVFGVVSVFPKKELRKSTVTNFEECVALGNPVMESYPRQCRSGEQTFTENIGNEIEKMDLIRLEYPRPNQIISSPLTITGQARGNWFFEASFPVVLTDWDGKIIAQGIATAKSEWMTTDFVPFEARLKFVVNKNSYSNRGFLILRRDNPSGLSEHDDALEIPVILAGITGAKPLPRSIACTMEVKLCPDGSAIGRTGPNCEFAECPRSGYNLPPGSIHNLPVPLAVSRVRSLVASELGISEGVVIVMTAYEKNWPDGCLGLGGDKMCTQATVPGYELTVQAKGTERIYRTNADGSVVVREK